MNILAPDVPITSVTLKLRTIQTISEAGLRRSSILINRGVGLENNTLTSTPSKNWKLT